MLTAAHQGTVADAWKLNVETMLSAYREADRASLRLPVLGTADEVAEPLLPVGMIRRTLHLLRVLYSLRRARSEQQMEALQGIYSREVWSLLAPWRGEAVLLSGGMVCRPLVSSLLAAHFRRRLALLRRWLLLDDSESKEREELLSSVDEALSIWQARRTLSGAITFVISVLGTVGGLVGVAGGVTDVPWWGWLLALGAVFIAYRVVAGSFVTKRGLMLGGSATTRMLLHWS